MIARTIRTVRSAVRRAHLSHHRAVLLRNVQGGDGLHLESPILVAHPEQLTLGRNVHIGHDARFNCLGGVTIGEHSIISGNVTIYSYNHRFRDATALPYDDAIDRRPVHIGRYVWIGMNVTIAPGTIIEDGAIIGIGTVVSGHVPAGAIAVSPRPRIVGQRDPHATEALLRDGCFHRNAA